MSPTNRTFPKKPAKTLSEEKSREFPHSLGSLRLFAAACANAGFGEDQGPGDLGQCLHANEGLNGTLVWNGPESSDALRKRASDQDTTGC
jgi:hypothetical protein